MGQSAATAPSMDAGRKRMRQPRVLAKAAAPASAPRPRDDGQDGDGVDKDTDSAHVCAVERGRGQRRARLQRLRMGMGRHGSSRTGSGDAGGDSMSSGGTATGRCIGSRAMLLWTLAALLALLVACDLVMEARIPLDGDVSHQRGGGVVFRVRQWFASRDPQLQAPAQRNDVLAPGAVLAERDACTPQVRDPRERSQVPPEYATRRFDELLRAQAPFAPPIFRGKFQVLCHDAARFASQFGYCLPIGGRRDAPFCVRADRMELLVRARAPGSFCYASVLHMAFVDVYNALAATGMYPLAAFGTLLGAVRNGSMIAFTEDAEIAYTRPSNDEMMDRVRERLWKHGYHMFHYHIWRVCVAPTHPLAALLFTPDNGLAHDYAVPYVDLYELRALSEGGTDADVVNASEWRLEGTKDPSRRIPRDKLLPYSSVAINGLAFDTVRDPVEFLLHEYGADYLTPQSRPDEKPFDRFEDFETADDDDELDT